MRCVVQSSAEQTPLISFLLLAYNQERFVREAIEGAFSQTYSPLEIVLSDDCSPDRTFAIMQEMAATYSGPHKVILNQTRQNVGLGAHINEAVKLAKGDWLVMAAGDDISLPNRVADSYSVIQKHGEVGGVFGRFHAFSGTFEDRQQWEPGHAADDHIVRGDDLAWLEKFERGVGFGTPGCVAMWNRKVFDLFGPIPEGVIGEDVLLGWRAFCSRLGVGFTAAHMVLYRSHGENLCAGQDSAEFSRKLLFTTAVAHREILQLKRNMPNLHTPEVWRRIIALAETSIFETVHKARVHDLGALRFALMSFFGIRKRRFIARLRYIRRTLFAAS
jgi:glycosyltransferase involved in cell wall biosynthesis